MSKFFGKVVEEDTPGDLVGHDLTVQHCVQKAVTFLEEPHLSTAR